MIVVVIAVLVAAVTLDGCEENASKSNLIKYMKDYDMMEKSMTKLNCNSILPRVGSERKF